MRPHSRFGWLHNRQLADQLGAKLGYPTEYTAYYGHNEKTIEL